jgi:hypothetical protein
LSNDFSPRFPTKSSAAAYLAAAAVVNLSLALFLVGIAVRAGSWLIGPILLLGGASVLWVVLYDAAHTFRQRASGSKGGPIDLWVSTSQASRNFDSREVWLEAGSTIGLSGRGLLVTRWIIKSALVLAFTLMFASYLVGGG